jgi:hypothetical protein
MNCTNCDSVGIQKLAAMFGILIRGARKAWSSYGPAG